MITGATRVAAVIGDPVRHSLSPALHNAAYRALDLDWVYVAFEVPAGKGAEALAAVRALELVGLSVTMPHKEDVAAHCDALTEDATALRSVNTVTRTDDGALLGSSTDGDGFMRALDEAGHAITPATRVLLLGAGGAARAVALALGRQDARVLVAARKRDAALAAAALATGEAVNWDDRAGAAKDADIIVNATPVGMGGDDALPLPASCLRPEHVVVDLVYHPIETPLLAAAAACGAAPVDGLGMLVHQAALQVECWSGQRPPVAVMRAAAQSTLAKRQ